MHIVFITHEYPKPNFPHGGVGTFIKSFTKWLVNHGHQVSVIGVNYTSNDEQENDDGVVIYRFQKGLLGGYMLNQSIEK